MIFIISMDFKRIIREAVEGEEDKKNLLDAVLGKILAIYSPIPKSPYSCWRVIKNIFESEGYDRYDVGVDVNLNASSNNASEGNKFKIKDRIRFFEFFAYFAIIQKCKFVFLICILCLIGARALTIWYI